MKYIFGFMCAVHVIAIFYVLYTTGEISRIDIALMLVWGAAVDITVVKEKVEKLEKIISECYTVKR